MISIIIPTLNEEKYLPLTLNEIKKQSFNDFEIIVSDAGSSDKTIELAKTAGCRIADGGGSPAKGRNEGAKIANGDLLLFMDADNISIPDNFLKELKEKFEMRNLDCASFPIFIEGNKLDRFLYGIYNFWVELSQSFLPHAFNSMIIKKDLHQKIKGFDEDIKLAEDHAYIRKAAKVGKFGFIRTKPMITSNRRFKKEGKLKGYLKYIFAGLYIALFGNIKNDIFKYRFGYEKDQDRK
jgi:glycosyltransferase involved in cell wall biosynthesis